MNCRACGHPETTLLVDLPAPSITSLATRHDGATRAFGCARCGHASKPSFANADRWYADEYDTVAGDDDDLMGTDERGEPVYRNDRQLTAVLDATGLPATGRALDHGCGHGVFLRRLAAALPGWSTTGFEVADRYASDDVVTGELPDGPFGLVTSLFVFEHLDDPRLAAESLASRLDADGTLIIVVPHAAANPADLLNVDHVSHFTPRSLATMLAGAGLGAVSVDDEAIPAALLAIARPGTSTAGSMPDEDLGSLGTYWNDARAALSWFLAQRDASTPVAIYGAGVYGAFLHGCCSAAAVPVACFLDRNPRKVGTSFLGCPVLAPPALPADVDTVLVGVRPESADAVCAAPELAGRNTFRLPGCPAPCTT